MLFLILLAVALIGLLSAAVLSTSDTEGSNIDNETLIIRTSEVQRFVSEMERGVLYIIQNGYSESDIRFAHPDAPSTYGDLSADADPADQLFSPSGGAAEYRGVPSGINDGSDWEFYGGTAAPGVGSERADLLAVLPNITQQFCERINTLNGQPTATPPDDPATCFYSGSTGRFNDSTQFASSPNTMDETTFTQDSTITAARGAMQACVTCGTDYHFYHVLMAR